MSYTIQESPYPGIWEVIYEGTVDLETRLHAFEFGRGVLELRKVRGCLVDFRQAQLSATEEGAYDLAKERLSSALVLGVRLALLFDSVPEEVDFEAVVAQNRGLELEIFCDEQEAYAWLRQSG